MNQCHDCAFLPTSPERKQYDRGDVGPMFVVLECVDMSLTEGEKWKPFYCHQGMPSNGPGNYTPEMKDGRPLLADGTPAPICAGWLAYVRRKRNQRRRIHG
jgi:hypothetical protein